MDYTPNQKKIIDRYYEHSDDIALTRLGEIVTDLFLATTQAKTKQLWKRAGAALKRLKLPDSTIDHILNQQSIELLTQHLKDLQNRAAPSAGHRPNFHKKS